MIYSVKGVLFFCQGGETNRYEDAGIYGELDRMCPVENARILASRIPNAELVILKKMGHLFWFEAQTEASRVVLEFLKRHCVSN